MAGLEKRLVPIEMLRRLDEDVLAAANRPTVSVTQLIPLHALPQEEPLRTFLIRFMLFATFPEILAAHGVVVSREGICYNNLYWIARAAEFIRESLGYRDDFVEQLRSEVVTESCRVIPGDVTSVLQRVKLDRDATP